MRTLIMFVIAALCAHIAHAQSTFTYQGELKDNGNPVNATKTLRFVLFDDESNPTPVESLGEYQVDIVDGLFTIELNPTISMGNDLYLEITVVDATEHVLSPRQRITFAPKSLYSLTTRGIHVDAQGRVGVGTESPDVALEVVQNPNDVQVFRLTDMLGQFQLRFRVALRNTLIQAWNLSGDIPETLFLNPMGGLTTLGPDGLSFNDGTVQTTAALRVFAIATGSGSAQTGETSSTTINIPGVLPTDFVLIINGSIGSKAIPHSPSALTNQVRVNITSASNEPFGSDSTSFTVVVLRP